MENPYAPSSGLIERVKAILTKPDETWPQIATEQSTPGEIVRSYAGPLLVLGPIAGFIGGQIFGIDLYIAKIKPGLISGLTSAVTSIVLALVSLFVAALITDFLAPKFKGTSDRNKAFKLVAYSMTPAWLAAILGLIMSPSIGMLIGLISLYGIYLFYKGATPLMKVPQDQVPIYMVVVAVASIVLSIIAGSIGSSVTRMMTPSPASLSEESVEINIPGVGKVDTANAEQFGKQMEAVANGEVKPVDTAKLQALLPASLGAYTRTSLDTGAMGAMGKGVSATYTSGDKSIKLSVIDSAGLGALAGMAGAIGVEQSHEDADGYDRTKSVNGQLVIEKWSKTGRGEFSQQVGGRFFISAEGEAGSIDELKSAVAGIDQGALAGLAK